MKHGEQIKRILNNAPGQYFVEAHDGERLWIPCESLDAEGRFNADRVRKSTTGELVQIQVVMSAASNAQGSNHG